MALMLPAGGAALAANAAGAVTTPGFGTLTKCRDWLVTQSCSKYHHVALPARVAVGDQIDLAFGSNPKEFTFHVVRIRHQGDSCTLYDAAQGDAGDTIKFAGCRATPHPAAAR